MLGRWPTVATLLGSDIAHEMIVMALSLFSPLSAASLPWGIGPEFAGNLFQSVLDNSHRSESYATQTGASSDWLRAFSLSKVRFRGFLTLTVLRVAANNSILLLIATSASTTKT